MSSRPTVNPLGLIVNMLIDPWDTQRGIPALSTFTSSSRDVMAYGARGDGKYVTDAAITTGTSVLTSATAAFTASDVGKLVVIYGAGALNGSLGTPFHSVITSVNDSTSANLADNAQNTVSGATAAYGTDDSAAFLAAYNDCNTGDTLEWPAGVFMTSKTLNVSKILRFQGHDSTIVGTADLFDFGSNYLSPGSVTPNSVGIQIRNLVFDVSGGVILKNCNWNNWHVADCRFVQRSWNYSAWTCANASANMLAGLVENCVFDVYGKQRQAATQTIRWITSIGGGLALVHFLNVHFGNKDGDTTDEFVYVECQGTHNYSTDFKYTNCTFDKAYAGCVTMLSTKAVSFDTCQIIDSFGAANTRSAYYIGASTAGDQWPSEHVSFRDCSRDLQGPNGTATWDIEVESTTDSVLVSNYCVRDIPGVSTFVPRFNFHGATNVQVEQCPDAIITNGATTGITLDGGNINFTGSLTGAALPNSWTPGDAGYIAWTFDPAVATGSPNYPASGTLFLSTFIIRTSNSVTGLSFCLQTISGTTFTSGQCFVGLFNSSGQCIAASADVSGSLNAVENKINFSSSVPVTPGTYFGAVLLNYTNTAPKIAVGSTVNLNGNAVGNAHKVLPVKRFGISSAYGTSLTTSSTVTLGSLTDPAGSGDPWMAIF